MLLCSLVCIDDGHVMHTCMHVRGWTPSHQHPFGVYSLRVFYTVRNTQKFGTQYAKIMLYNTHTSNFTFKRWYFIKKHNNRDVKCSITLKNRTLPLLALTRHLSILKTQHGLSKIKNYQANTTKLTFPRVCHKLYFCFLRENRNAKKVVLLLNVTQYANPK